MLAIEQIQQLLPNLEQCSQRLKLRLFGPQDEAFEVKQQQDPQVMKYIRPPLTLEQAQAFFEKVLTPWSAQEGEWLGLAVERISDGVTIGGVSFRFESIDFEIAEIGYRFDASYQGQGYGTEAVKLLVDWLFTQVKVHKIVAKCDPDNNASYRIMEKLNMQKEALLREHYKMGDIYTDELICGLLAREYQAD